MLAKHKKKDIDESADNKTEDTYEPVGRTQKDIDDADQAYSLSSRKVRGYEY